MFLLLILFSGYSAVVEKKESKSNYAMVSIFVTILYVLDQMMINRLLN